MTLEARIDHQCDRSPAIAGEACAGTETRPNGDAPRLSLVQHWPLLFIMAGAAAMIGWTGAIVWAAICVVTWMVN